MNRNECLDKARQRVMADRVQQYGPPENSFSKIAALWSDYLGHQLFPHDVAAMLILMKVARLSVANKDDSWIDIAGYAACGAEVDARTYKVQEDVG